MINFFKLILIFIPFIFISNSFADKQFVGKISPIPNKIKKQMIGTTWKKGCPVFLDQLSYLNLTYWGFDNKPHKGELIINKAIAQNTLSTFKQLYKMRFPIESMKLRSYYFKHPNNPTRKNNSSAFSCRKDAQSPKKLSLHSYGIAIDLNPFYNPALVAGGKIEPEGAEKYLNRKLKHKGMIFENDKVCKIMTKNGWAWGNYFKTGTDPMHFEKIITRQYIIKSLEFFPNKWGLDVAL